MYVCFNELSPREQITRKYKGWGYKGKSLASLLGKIELLNQLKTQFGPILGHIIGITPPFQLVVILFEAIGIWNRAKN